MKYALAALMLLPAPGVAQELVFDITPTAACIRAGGGESCAGKAAEQCMQATPGGHTTVAMSGCRHREGTYWDGRLAHANRPQEEG